MLSGHMKIRHVRVRLKGNIANSGIKQNPL